MHSNHFLVFFTIFSLACASPQRNGNNGNTGNNNNGNANANGGNNNANNGGNGGLTLNTANVQKASASNGNPSGGQSASQTDSDNFINFCDGKQITNGAQVTGGSCNGIVMGDIPSKDNMISSIILNPAPGQNIAANTDFTIQVQIANLVAGVFTNPDNTYYAAPQSLQGGKVVGHCHVTVQDLGNSLSPKTPPTASTFAFFKGIDDAGNGNGLLSATVTGGLPAGNYRVCTMNSASNHQPVLMPVAQRGAQDDCTKFTVGGNGSNNNANGANGANGNNGNNANNGNQNANGGNGNANTGNGNAGSTGNTGNTGKNVNGGTAGNGNNNNNGRANGQQSNQAATSTSSAVAAGSTSANNGCQKGNQAAAAAAAAPTGSSNANGNAGKNGCQTAQGSATASATATSASGTNGNTNAEDGSGRRFRGNQRRNRFQSRDYIAV